MLARDVSRGELHRALVMLTACLHVYRTYVDEGTASASDIAAITRAREEARSRVRSQDRPALDFIARVLAGQTRFSAPDQHKVQRRFVMRWQQFSGPVMAKGVEDTALYRHTPLLALNEVGSHPSMPLDPVGAFHELNRFHQRHYPLTMTSTATHDSKRGEDLRARLCVLSELTDEWIPVRDACIRKLHHSSPADDPDFDEASLLLQTVVGAWPLSEPEHVTFSERLEQFLIKAAREAKRGTSWLHPDDAHEARVVARAGALLAAIREDEAWTQPLMHIQEKIAFFGAVGALAQLVLKVASPGVPDIFQGRELWDLSLVDPDNRRAVDWTLRRQRLAKLSAQTPSAQLLTCLLASWSNGDVKLYTSVRALRCRRVHPELFTAGRYLPVTASTPNVVAFARQWRQTWAIACVPRLIAQRGGPGKWPIGAVWAPDHLQLPAGAPRRWTDVFTQNEARPRGRQLALESIFGSFPVALLLGSSGADAGPNARRERTG
jgi:(1->4)-alpha-D-glucan 1-alpha-D-glucosylmutase